MGKADRHILLEFLKPFDEEVIARVMWLRDFGWNLCTTANELIYDNYNAVAFGWSLTERQSHIICSVAVGRTSGNVHFGFLQGSNLPDPLHLLLGKGSQYRYFLVKDVKTFPHEYAEKLVSISYRDAKSRVKNPAELVQGKTLVKSISENKRTAKRAVPVKRWKK